jgi:acetyltransferase-like isoleucine patch superfamily enzyme
MASIHFLWTHRAKFTIGSVNFYKAWAKRFLTLKALIRRNLYRKKLSKQGAMIDERAEVGEIRAEGNKRNLTIGKFTFIGNVYIALHDRVEIGERVCINDGVEILTASHNVYDPEWKHVKGKIVIEDYAWIGTGAMILPGVHIGYGAVIGARAVVSKSVPSRAIVVGNPAKPTNKSRAENLNYNPCDFLAANRAWLIG